MISSGLTNTKICISEIGTVKLNENIEKDRSATVAIREQYYKQQQEPPPPSSTFLRTALLATLKNKLRANESELTELRKMVDAGKGGFPVSHLLEHLGCQTEKISCLGGTDNNVLQKLEVAIRKKEEECHKARKLIGEASRNQQESTPRNPIFISSVLPTQSSPSSSSSNSKKKSETRAPEIRNGGSEEGRRVPRSSKTSNDFLYESSHSSRSKSSHSSSSSGSKKKSETRAPEIRNGGSEEGRRVPRSSKTSNEFLIDESSYSCRSKSSHSSSFSGSKKKSETRAPEIRNGGSEEGRRVPRSSKTSNEFLIDESLHSCRSSKSSHSSSSSRSKKKPETRAPEIRSGRCNV